MEEVTGPCFSVVGLLSDPELITVIADITLPPSPCPSSGQGGPLGVAFLDALSLGHWPHFSNSASQSAVASLTSAPAPSNLLLHIGLLTAHPSSCAGAMGTPELNFFGSVVDQVSRGCPSVRDWPPLSEAD